MDTRESLILDATDINFCLYDWLDAESLTGFDRFAEHSRETFDGLLDLSRQLAEDLFAPHNRTGDLNEPTLVDGKVQLIDEVKPALDAFAEAGLLSATMDGKHGGFRLPALIYRAAFLWFQAANLGTVSYALLTTGAANLISTHATEELQQKFLPPMLDGRWSGTMNLSEPGTGSALGDLTTSATKQDDGTYRVRGDKMWISGGDQEVTENIVHLVLARTGGPGVKGLSLFIVPKWLENPGEPGCFTERNGVSLVGINHKMGYRGTVNTALNYDDAVGYLIGEEGKGLFYMFHMMNEARIGVGAGATALGVTGFLHSRDYARGRIQGRPLDAKDPKTPAVPIIRHADVRRMLLEQKAYAEGAVAVVLYTAKVLDESVAASSPEEREAAHLLLEVLTPVAKSWPSQWCLEGNSLAIQVLGGSGYTRDHPVEQFYRDNRLNPIHEGTHGIQGIDLLGRKVLLSGGSGFRDLLGRITATCDALADSHPELADPLRSRATRLAEATATVWEDKDAGTALANATMYLEAAGDIVVAWLLADQVRALGERNGTGESADSFAESKLLTASFFIDHLLPRADARLDLVASKDRRLHDLDDSLI
ncbi:acyl-CoA dehydrogenase [Corynebacterium sp.]|jgi:alkylation response protein AidB-like acyl-CoA dehydrogenase|uniref:acyl-CoA dehydrogenase n=1 Tax=Corynebacterium sp. TaxID=1720 RepID=UPI0025C222C2|nr:acyl-CoA dehydrogenase [Corynebacterium sp.]